MEPINLNKVRNRIKTSLTVFIILLALSGITAFPLETELNFLNSIFSNKNAAVFQWIEKVFVAVHDTNQKYPFFMYGTDWLAFAHIVIAISFFGPLVDPVKNTWVLQFGMIACVLVIPMAFIAGSVRDIPLLWRLIDCSFGVFGLIPLWISYKNTRILERALYIPATDEYSQLTQTSSK